MDSGCALVACVGERVTECQMLVGRERVRMCVCVCVCGSRVSVQE